jgi:hypothetical protein
MPRRVYDQPVRSGEDVQERGGHDELILAAERFDCVVSGGTHCAHDASGTALIPALRAAARRRGPPDIFPDPAAETMVVRP